MKIIESYRNAIIELTSQKEFEPILIEIDLTDQFIHGQSLRKQYDNDIRDLILIDQISTNILTEVVMKAFHNKIVGLVAYRVYFSTHFRKQLLALVEGSCEVINSFTSMYDLLLLTHFNHSYLPDRLQNLAKVVLNSMDFFNLNLNEIQSLLSVVDEPLVNFLACKISQELIRFDSKTLFKNKDKISAIPVAVLDKIGSNLQWIFWGCGTSQDHKKTIEHIFQLDTININYDYRRQGTIKIKRVNNE